MAAAVHKLRRKSNKPVPDRKDREQDRTHLPTRRRTGAAWKEFILDFKEVLGWVLLVPWCLFSFIAFTELLIRATREGGVWGSREFVWFTMGVIVWLMCFAAFRRVFMIVYVFGHEWSHLLAAKMCGAVVYDWHVGHDGGWVDTNKSNTFISLAPYIVPFYSVGIILLYGIAGLFVNLDKVQQLNLGFAIVPFDALKSLCFLIGMTWCFHVTYTLNTLRIEQSDVKRNGSFFSGWLIFLVNLHLIVALLIVASPTLTWSDAWTSTQAAAEWTFGKTLHFIGSMGMNAWNVATEMWDQLNNWKVK